MNIKESTIFPDGNLYPTKEIKKVEKIFKKWICDFEKF